METMPPPSVRRAFALEGHAACKQVDDPAEAAWTQALLHTIEPAGFRVARPIRSTTGEWVVGGWIASHWIDGLRPTAPDWGRIVAAGEAFAAAATGADQAPAHTADVLGRRTHRWAVADRVAWGEDEVDLPAEAAEIQARLARYLDPAAEHHPRQIVHGDLTGNVFLDPDDVPVVLDVSPYLRPLRWGAAVVTGDALLWHGGTVPSLPTTAPDLLARALLFRLVAELPGADLAPFRRATEALAAAEPA